ncbi:head-tail adaptor protein [Corynebacterium silvaticum]|uniref:phage head completion protein n=1 Tax=Corynebacterium silvaticum TaxID=2320431 RepID=UPI00106894E6|nr:head-tail adaptor protein [Corynebacterium silvaticum]MBH5299852.1 head-tail adaptor protein [Corynebacterium silvaticum]NOM65744.1 head-tail adaptor protein [Corynebacterium silvaticum]TFA91558.1 head-tail adaptor protein [Corynebacterium silvaticum]TFA92580.1 head-tail adaptor protein [Corynebacterium silvaticum]TNX78721.1 head-tail adaptor protein [Corynebacterium silvaticum]
MAGIGSMREHIDLIVPVVVRDKAGFTTTNDRIVATVRAYRETRHATAAWVNRAAYTNATVLFRIRTMPGLDVTEAMEIATHDGRFVIDTVEVIGRYVEILAHQSVPEGELNHG